VSSTHDPQEVVRWTLPELSGARLYRGAGGGRKQQLKT
jgi:hypothetical protein